MNRQVYASFGIFLCAAIIAGGIFYHRARAPAACDSTEALDRLQPILQQTLNYPGVFINQIRTVSGGLFDTTRSCAAEVSEIQGNRAASDMHWRLLTFTMTRSNGGPTIISAQVGEDTTLAPPELTFWQKLRARF